MKLTDIRRLAIRQQTTVRFVLSNGMDCVVDEHGIARVPGLKEAPSFNLEDEFARAQQLQLRPQRGAQTAQNVTRAELERIVAGSASTAAVEEHEE